MSKRRTRSGGSAEHSAGLSLAKTRARGQRTATAGVTDVAEATGRHEDVVTADSSEAENRKQMHVINVPQWLEENKTSFLPPVCNRMMHQDGQLKIMYIGGPNERRDYHIEEGEEMFYMAQGDMCLKIIEKGKPKDVPIKEGEIFVLPSRIPHSPQRDENTRGLVIERERQLTEKDGLRFYCEDGVTVLYEEWFHCTDLGTQLVPIITRYKESEEFKTGKPNKHAMSKELPLKIDVNTEVDHPVLLKQWLTDNKSTIASKGSAELYGNGEFKVSVFGVGSEETINTEHETYLWQLEGDSTVISGNSSCVMHKDDTLLIPSSLDTTYTVKHTENSLQMVIWIDELANKE